MLLHCVMADPSTDLLVTLFVIALVALLGVALWAWTAFQSNANRHSKAPARTTSVPPRSATGKSERPRRRVIRLYSITPGQSPYEYNIGDDNGTRASALVRVA